MLFAQLVTQVEVSPSKRALLHLSTPVPPPPLCSPCQDRALQLREPANSHCRMERGAEEKTGGRIVISHQQTAENGINYKQSGLEGSCQTVVGLGWQNPRGAAVWCQPMAFSVGWEGMEPL